MDWFRVYDSIIDDPKVLRLSPAVRWFYVALLAVGARSSPRGSLPDREDIAIHLRLNQRYSNRVIACLVENGLIDKDENTQALTMHGWDGRQRVSDDSYERVKRFRDRYKKRDETVTRVRASDTDTDTDNTPLPPTGGGGCFSSSALGPEYKPVGLLAEELGGDSSWCMWVKRQGIAGQPADWIKAALLTASGNGVMSKSYALKILQGYVATNGPPKPVNSQPPKPAAVHVTAEAKAEAKAAQQAAEARIRELEASKRDRR